jgi:glycosyltransferase involved in cell wall biosynthesis
VGTVRLSYVIVGGATGRQWENAKLPTVSVVVPSYNGANGGLKRLLRDLALQDYPTALVQIVVVDDCSLDDTAAVSRQAGAQVVTHDKNRGVGAARATGLFAARGEIYVSLDDDCELDANWLRELVAPFADESVVGVGGVVRPSELRTSAQRYLAASGYGNPASLELDSAAHVTRRLRAYFVSRYRHPAWEGVTPVREVYGANAAFRRSALLAAGGYDATLTAGEDTDISSRVRAAYPECQIVANPRAIAATRYRPAVRSLISTAYSRAAPAYVLARKQRRVAPWFPMPGLVFVIWLITAGYSRGARAKLGRSIVIPPLVYHWWLVRRDLGFISRLEYAYLEFAVDVAHDLGMGRETLRTRLAKSSRR